MAESTLTSDLDRLRRAVTSVLGMRSDYAFGNVEQRQAIDDLILGGLRRFYYPLDRRGRAYHWRFLYPRAFLNTVTPHNTGTVTISSGTATFTAAFPSWVTNSEDLAQIQVDNTTYNITGFDTVALTATLQDTSLTAAAGTEFVLIKNRYQMEDDFGGMRGPFTYQPGKTGYYPKITQVAEEVVRKRRQDYDYSNRPRVFCLYPKAFDATEGQRWVLEFYPTVDDAYELEYVYQTIPNDLTVINKYHLGGAPYSQALTRCCELEADLVRNDEPNSRFEKPCMDALQIAILHDAGGKSPQDYGYNYDHRDLRQKMIKNGFRSNMTGPYAAPFDTSGLTGS